MIFAGTLLPLSLAPFHYYPLAIISLALLFNGLRQTKTPLQTAAVATLFGLGMFGLGVYWVFVALSKFGDLGWFLSGLMTAVFVSFLASVLGFVFWLSHRPIHRGRTSHDLLWLFPVTWFGFEWFKTWFLTGFPWLEVGAGQIEGPLSSYIPLVGTQGV
ncbi:MAG: apolipoprotein N-acyltransferase, partial [Methylococcales bacterium]|nr:apolipoprotein N-acyltransferase [Methylococcales bacterium]